MRHFIISIRAPRAASLLAVLYAGATVAGCAGASPGAQTALADGAGATAANGFALTAEERALDCRKLTGRLQVRLLELRGAEFKSQTTGLSDSIRSAASTLLFTDTGKNAQRRAQQNRPMLDAYNGLLVEKGCASFDIDKELAQRPSAPTPTPTVPAAKAKSP